MRLTYPQERILKALYESIKNNALYYKEVELLQKTNNLRILEHNIFYGTISDVKIDTGLISDKAADFLAEGTSENELTMDHTFSPERYAGFFYKNIMNMTFEQFLEYIIPLCYVIRVTKKENNELMNLEKANKKENKFVIDKYEQIGITIRRGYQKHNKIPDDIMDAMPSLLKEIGYNY